ncbi:4-hydroxybenzoate octaprenyltransferase [Kingella potus]|uniref:4-hydroxybenzoate octaprenyltransferase n=1 Tax=Kingella potus TaxID=265175 RepID=A0A377R051_9NEIS|nr:4-hydroxybenzoate octaprenyltransferase [Kingella potus]STR00360.1 4-hydroxybenzoate octaprenyltransferase [Kingella potus]
MDKEKIKKKLGIYARLMRTDKPIGTMLLLWPTLWGLWAAAGGLPPPVILLCFVLGTFLMRSAGCVANDFADRNFDGKVARTKNRPFARGEVSAKEALLLTLVLCLAAALCLLPLNRATWLAALPALFLALTYPFTKRFFPIPQLYLGLAFSFGIPMAFTAVGGRIPPLAWILFAANIFWTLAYDTAYAMADKADDLKIGIKTSAITFGRYDAQAVFACHLASTALMAWAGWEMRAGWPFWLAFPFVLHFQYKQYLAVRTRDRDTCFREFLANNRLGGFWFAAIAAHFFCLHLNEILANYTG